MELKKMVKEFIKKLRRKIKEEQEYLNKNYSYEETIMGSEECLRIIDELSKQSLLGEPNSQQIKQEIKVEKLVETADTNIKDKEVGK